MAGLPATVINGFRLNEGHSAADETYARGHSINVNQSAASQNWGADTKAPSNAKPGPASAQATDYNVTHPQVGGTGSHLDIGGQAAISGYMQQAVHDLMSPTHRAGDVGQATGRSDMNAPQSAARQGATTSLANIQAPKSNNTFTGSEPKGYGYQPPASWSGAEPKGGGAYQPPSQTNTGYWIGAAQTRGTNLGNTPLFYNPNAAPAVPFYDARQHAETGAGRAQAVANAAGGLNNRTAGQISGATDIYNTPLRDQRIAQRAGMSPMGPARPAPLLGPTGQPVTNPNQVRGWEPPANVPGTNGQTLLGPTGLPITNLNQVRGWEGTTNTFGPFTNPWTTGTTSSGGGGYSLGGGGRGGGGAGGSRALWFYGATLWRI